MIFPSWLLDWIYSLKANVLAKIRGNYTSKRLRVNPAGRFI